MTSVKHFHSAMVGAPALTGAAGTLIAVLDACLITGFGLKTAQSLVVTSGVATMTFSTAHSFERDTVALLAGASTAELNGEQRITAVTALTASFLAPGVADGPVAGTITAKLAPAGWEKPFSGSSVAVYRSTNITGSRMFLRVDDSNALNSRVIGYEAMSDVNTGVGPFPNANQVAGGAYWPKAASAGSAALSWTVAADSLGFYLHMHTTTTAPGSAGSVWYFGDFASWRNGDPYACALFADTAANSGSGSVQARSVEYASQAAGNGPFIARSFTGLGGSVQAVNGCESYQSNASGSAGTMSMLAAPTYPNGPNNGLLLSRKILTEPSVCLRGFMPGLLMPVQNCHMAFGWRDKIDGQGGQAGRRLLAVKCGGSASSNSQGLVFLDITGPWEYA